MAGVGTVMPPSRDRRIRAVREFGAMSQKPRALRAAAGAARRLTARTRPILHRSAPAQALQGALLQRIDVSEYNAAGPPDLHLVVSQTVTAAQVQSPQYASWARVLGEEPRFHRKQWEYVIVLEAADQAGVLREGCAAVGFGVGTEPLPAALASRGVQVLATDQAAENAGHWTRRGEHSADVEALQKPAICPPDRFRRLASFRPVDMMRCQMTSASTTSSGARASSSIWGRPTQDSPSSGAAWNSSAPVEWLCTPLSSISPRAPKPPTTGTALSTGDTTSRVYAVRLWQRASR